MSCTICLGWFALPVGVILYYVFIPMVLSVILKEWLKVQLTADFVS